MIEATQITSKIKLEDFMKIKLEVRADSLIWVEDGYVLVQEKFPKEIKKS